MKDQNPSAFHLRVAVPPAACPAHREISWKAEQVYLGDGLLPYTVPLLFEYRRFESPQHRTVYVLRESRANAGPRIVRAMAATATWMAHKHGGHHAATDWVLEATNRALPGLWFLRMDWKHEAFCSAVAVPIYAMADKSAAPGWEWLAKAVIGQDVLP